MTTPSSPRGGYAFIPYSGDYMPPPPGPHLAHIPPLPPPPNPHHYPPAPHQYAVIPQHQASGAVPDLPVVHSNNGSSYPPHMTILLQPGSTPNGSKDPSMMYPSTCPTAAAGEKMMRQLLGAMNKLSSVMTQIGEKQGEILDRLSLLEQKVGRIDKAVGKLDNQGSRIEKVALRAEEKCGQLELQVAKFDHLSSQCNRLEKSIVKVDEKVEKLNQQTQKLDQNILQMDEHIVRLDDEVLKIDDQLLKTDEVVYKVLETTELTGEDCKSIRARVDDNESQEALERRLTMLMDGVVEKLIGGLGNEMKDIKISVQETEKALKREKNWAETPPLSPNGFGHRVLHSVNPREPEKLDHLVMPGPASNRSRPASIDVVRP